MKGSLLKTQKAFEFHNVSLKEKVFLHAMINPIMSQLPPISKDPIVLQNHLFNLVGGQQDLLMVLLSVYLNPLDLRSVGPPFNLSIIYLKRKWVRAIKKSYICSSHPVFKLHNVGEGTEMYCCGVLNSLGCLVKTVVGTSPVQDSHLEQVDKNWIINPSLIYSSEPFCSSDHIHPQLVIKE